MSSVAHCQAFFISLVIIHLMRLSEGKCYHIFMGTSYQPPMTTFEFLIFIVNLILLTLSPLISFYKIDKSHYFWANKDWVEKLIYIPLFIFLFVTIRLGFLVTYYVFTLKLVDTFTLSTFSVISIGTLLDIVYWLVIKKVKLFLNKPAIYRYTIYYFNEAIIISLLMRLTLRVAG